MGLDQYAYAASKAGQYDEYYETGKWDSEKQEYVDATVSKPVEIAYWRKHPSLQGWMENLWFEKLADQGDNAPDPKGWGSSFNNVELELTREDLKRLREDVLAGNLPQTEGFFFGNDSSDYYKEEDLKFIDDALADNFLGFKIFYNSSW